MCVSYRLICQCVIRVGCYENYTRNTQTALVCTLLPVSYMLRCACWTSVCTKLCRRGQDVEHHRRARCDGSSAPCSGGPQISPHSCAAGAEGPLILAGQNRDFPRGKVAPCFCQTSRVPCLGPLATLAVRGGITRDTAVSTKWKTKNENGVFSLKITNHEP